MIKRHYALQASFYSYAAFGKGLDEEMLGGGPLAKGGKPGNLTGAVFAYAQEVAADEIKYCPWHPFPI